VDLMPVIYTSDCRDTSLHVGLQHGQG